MRRAGFDDPQAARLYRVFADFILGYSAVDAGLAALEPAIRDADLLSWEIQYRTLPQGQYLNTAANFTTTVDLMIEAIRARAATPRDPSTPPGIRA